MLALVLPFALLLSLTLVLRRPLWQAAGSSFVVAIALWWWSESGADLFFPCVRAFILACEVGLILFGAVAFLDYMSATGTTDRIRVALSEFTGKKRSLDALLLAWLFCGFLEGAAGFGAPAALVAPLLASLGFPQLSAAVLPLIGDSAAVLFGAVGTPVRVGLAGLPATGAGVYGAGLNLVAGLVAPIAIAQLAASASQDGTKSGYFRALWAGLCFTVPAFVVSFIGPEFPSLAGSLTGLVLFSATLSSPIQWRRLAGLLKTFTPYLVVCLFLLTGKLTISTIKFGFEVGDRTLEISAFQPGLVFLLVMAMIALWRRDRGWVDLKADMAAALGRLPSVWLAIFCLAGMAQLVVFNTGAPSVPQTLSGWTGQVALLLMAPVAGAMAAFVAGSATVACLLAGPFLSQTAQIVGLNIDLVLGLLLVGSGAGNMISLQNLAAVQATVGMKDQERAMLAKLWRPCAAYVVLASLCGLMLWGLG